MAIAQRLLPRERPRVGEFSAADKAKLNSIEFGANNSLPDIEENNIIVTAQSDVLNFKGFVNVTDTGFQTDIEVPEDLDGGILP